MSGPYTLTEGELHRDQYDSELYAGQISMTRPDPT